MKEAIHYRGESKIRIAEEVLSGKITKEECRYRFGIKGNSTVLRRIRKSTGTYTRLSDMSIEPKSEENERLREQLRLLKSELEYDRLRSISYLEKIKIAEEYLKISIRKKSGARQSKKVNKEILTLTTQPFNQIVRIAYQSLISPDKY